MSVFERVTRQQLGVYAVLYSAFTRGEALHGYLIKRGAGITGPSTYRILDRLREHRLVDSWWEELPPGESRPRRRYYQLTPAGAAAVRAVLQARRPDVLAEASDNRQAPAWHPQPGFGTALHRLLVLSGDS